MPKYSEIRKKLNIEIDNKTKEGLAFLTHYFQNHKNGVSQFFKPGALEYLTELHEELNIFEEPEFQYYLPINWDIPFPPQNNPTFKFIDLFAGIGGIRLAYQNLGGKCVFTSEWNSFSKKTYEANFGEVPFGDITKISEKEIPDHDILLAGFPCQPFSIAGVSKKNDLGVPMPSQQYIQTHRHGRAIRFNLFSQHTKTNAKKRIFASIPNAVQPAA